MERLCAEPFESLAPRWQREVRKYKRERQATSLCQITTSGYGTEQGQLGIERGETFWTAARQVVEQTYHVLTPGAHAIWVCKDFVRDKARVPFSHQWAQLCEACGFEWLHEHRAWVVEDYGTQLGFFEDQPIIKERKSFFRRLAEKNGSPRIDWESVLCFRRP